MDPILCRDDGPHRLHGFGHHLGGDLLHGFGLRCSGLAGCDLRLVGSVEAGSGGAGRRLSWRSGRLPSERGVVGARRGSDLLAALGRRCSGFSAAAIRHRPTCSSAIRRRGSSTSATTIGRRQHRSGLLIRPADLGRTLPIQVLGRAEGATEARGPGFVVRGDDAGMRASLALGAAGGDKLTGDVVRDDGALLLDRRPGEGGGRLRCVAVDGVARPRISATTLATSSGPPRSVRSASASASSRVTPAPKAPA